MSKVKYPKPAENVTVTNLAKQVEELSGSLESWLKCREDRLKAQVKLLQSCKNDEDVRRYKVMGLLNFKGKSF